MKMEAPTTLRLGFKGNRTYVQAGDFVDAVAALIEPRIGGFLSRMTFHRFARRDCALWMVDPAEADRTVASGSWTRLDGSALPVRIVETDDEIVRRRPYDESLITDPAVVDGTSVRAPRKNEYSAIENVIALTKILNYAHTPEVDGKWVVGRVDLEAPLPDVWNEMAIETVSVIAGKFSRNRIVIDNARAGEIRFIVGRP